MNAVVQQLNDNQQVLGKLINQTNQGVINAFTIQDGNLHVQRRIFNDMAKDLLKEGCEGTLKVLEDGNIDWKWYFHEYEMMKLAIAFVMWVKKLIGEPAAEKADEQEEGEDFVFGGDYAHSNNSEG